MTTRGLTFAWLVALWVALWGRLTAANVLTGLAVAAVLLRAFPVRVPQRDRSHVRPLRLLRFLGYFAVKLVEANAVVAWEVITPSNRRVNEGIVAVPLCRASGVAITILANAITLTPGTLVVDIGRDPATLFIHVLHLRSIEQARLDVLRLEQLLVRAVGSYTAIAELEAIVSDAEEVSAR